MSISTMTGDEGQTSLWSGERVDKDSLRVEEFKEQMAGVFSTCVSEDTLDESPMAYKPMNDVLGRIGETIDIQFIAKPLWNYKAQKGD